LTFPSCAPSERLGSVHSFRVVLSPPRVNSPTRSQVLSFSRLTFSTCAPSERPGSVHSFRVVHSTLRHISSAPTTPRAVSACRFTAYLNTFRARVRSFTLALSRGGWPGVCVARRRRPRRGRGFPPAASRRPATSRVQAARRWRASPGRVRSPCSMAVAPPGTCPDAIAHGDLTSCALFGRRPVKVFCPARSTRLDPHPFVRELVAWFATSFRYADLTLVTDTARSDRFFLSHPPAARGRHFRSNFRRRSHVVTRSNRLALS